MKLIAISEQQLKNPQYYKSIKLKHIVISITSSDKSENAIPYNVSRLDTLHLKFDDVEDIDNRFIYFDRGMAKEIFEFVEKNCSQVDLIVVQCESGQSRSVAVASALSKIINYVDDAIFTTGVPNMFVYATILDCYFSNMNYDTIWPKINYLRKQSMLQYLTPSQIRNVNLKRMGRLDT